MSQQDPDIPQIYIVLSKIPVLVCTYIYKNFLETVLQLPWTSVSQTKHFRAPHNSPPLAKMIEISRMSLACYHVKDVNGHQKVEFLVGIPDTI